MQMTIAFLTRLQYLAWLEVVHPLQERSIAAMREINKLWYELSLKNNQQQQKKKTESGFSGLPHQKKHHFFLHPIAKKFREFFVFFRFWWFSRFPITSHRKNFSHNQLRMADTESEKNKAVVRIQSIQRGKAAREEKRNKDKAAAKIQSIQRGKSTRLEQKMKDKAATKLQKTAEAEVQKLEEDEEPQSNDFDNTKGTNFGCETRNTNFGDDTGGDEIRGAAETINNTQIEKFSTFTKKDGYFTGKYPETTDTLLSSPREPSRLQQAQEDLIVTVGQEQHKSVHSNYEYCKWFARKSNAVRLTLCC
jgi:hypothetical protein